MKHPLFLPYFVSLCLIPAMPSTAWAEEPVRADAFAATPVLPGAVSTQRNEYNFQVSDDGNIATFARANADFSEGKVYLMERQGDAWAPPEQIIFSDERYKDSDPWLSPDGRTLYFISDRPTSAGETKEAHDYDIWRMRRVEGTWIAPEHLGGVNSSASEFGPEVHGDYLYFSSTRTGEYEIYRARLENGSVSVPEALPIPINSESIDSDITLSPGGRVAVWCSRRVGGAGSCDLHVSHLTQKGWTTAQNLGSRVNTEGSEFTPSFSPNGARLYFASSRSIEGQEPNASDIYEIAVANVPALQAALAASTLDRLRSAFGGASVLAGLKRISFTLEMRDAKANATRASYIYDFARTAVMRRTQTDGTEAIDYARGDDGIRLINGKSVPLDPAEQAALLRGLELNFLKFLGRADAELRGPFDRAGQGNLQWYQLAVDGVESPLLGLDPQTGRVVKMQINETRHLLETDYLPVQGGLVWPHRFIVPGGDTVREGRFSHIVINPPFPRDAPAWLTR